MTEPQQVMASALYEIVPNLSLMGNVGWQNWTEFGEFPVGISARNQTSIEANLHFSDTYQIAIGQQYRLAERWLWSAGFAYDSSPVSQANRIAVLPFDRQLRYGTGIQYEITRDLTAGAAWEFMDAGPGPFSNTEDHSPERCKDISRQIISTSSRSMLSGNSRNRRGTPAQPPV